MSAFGGVLDSTFGLMRDKHVVGSATLKRNVKIKRKNNQKSSSMEFALAA